MWGREKRDDMQQSATGRNLTQAAEARTWGVCSSYKLTGAPGQVLSTPPKWLILVWHNDMKKQFVGKKR